MWTTLCGHGYPDIGYLGLRGQPPVDMDIRILFTKGYVDNPTSDSDNWIMVTQGYVDNPLRARISGH